MKRFIYFCTVSLLIISLTCVTASAYTFGPGISTFTTNGANSSHFFSLKNKDPKITPVEIALLACHKDIDGKLVIGEEAEDAFIVYPAQVVLMPGDEVEVQVRWIGGDLEAEQTYVILASEVSLPEEFNEKMAEPEGTRIDVNVLINYQGLIYVTPERSAPDIRVESVRQLDTSEEKNNSTTLEVILANHGTKHTKMKNPALVLMREGSLKEGDSVTLTAEQLPELKSNIFAGGKRRLRFARPAGLTKGVVKAILKQ